jgi:Barstar (barnase inhibitor)
MHAVRYVVLDGSLIDSQASFLAAVAVALNFPEYFGGNWDALDDCLYDVDEPTLIEWTEADGFADADPLGFAMVARRGAEIGTPKPNGEGHQKRRY